MKSICKSLEFFISLKFGQQTWLFVQSWSAENHLGISITFLAIDDFVTENEVFAPNRITHGAFHVDSRGLCPSITWILEQSADRTREQATYS